MATTTNDKPLRLGDLPVVKTNILENAREFDKGVVGGYNGIFPLTAASQGGIYLLPSTGKFYVCETAYNGVQISAPNSNFVELSVWKNHDRLSNLKIKLINDNQNYKLYENSTFYFIELKKGIKVENKVILNIPNFTLRGEQFLFSIPSTSTIGGPWGHNNLVCSVTDYNITIINEIDNTTNYTLNSMIIIPKL